MDFAVKERQPISVNSADAAANLDRDETSDLSHPDEAKRPIIMAFRPNRRRDNRKPVLN
jgi:hypothetical protein